VQLGHLPVADEHNGQVSQMGVQLPMSGPQMTTHVWEVSSSHIGSYHQSDRLGAAAIGCEAGHGTGF
jgi:hypothetical protein